MILDLETSIKTKLQSITRFANVYDNFTHNTTWYPYAAFELTDFDGAFLDVCSNVRNFKFNIVVVQEMNETLTRATAKTILYKCLEDIISNFDWDQDLWNWNIVKWDVSKWTVWTFLWKEWSILALSVELTLQVITNAW